MVKESALVDSALLKPIGMISLPDLPAFNAGEKYRLGMTDGMKIGYIGSNFNTHFGGKKEKNLQSVELRIHLLRQRSKDPAIIAELGGEEKVETYLATMFAMMKKQGTGQTGDLLVNGYANIFYIKDDDDTLWAVLCLWAGSSWRVEAPSLSHPCAWPAGRQVFSR